MSVRQLSIACACAAALLAAPGRADVLFSVSWGSGPGQIGYAKGRSAEPAEQPRIRGPAGIALGLDGEIWISDPLHDRVLRFARNGRRIGAVTELGGHPLERPGAIWTDRLRRVAVASLSRAHVQWWDRKTDTYRELLDLGGSGESLRQVELLVGDYAGAIWAGDYGLGAIVHFDAKGTFVTRRPWSLRGLTLDREGHATTLATLGGRGGAWDLVSYAPEGPRIQTLPLAPGAHEAPFLIGSDLGGRIYVRVREGEEAEAGDPAGRGPFAVMRFDPETGDWARIGAAPAPVLPAQFSVDPPGRVLALGFDPETAPAGAVEVIELRKGSAFETGPGTAAGLPES